MATLDESYLDLMEYDTSCIVRIQAVCRGWLSRKKLKTAQTDFLEIVGELDGPAVKVEWTDVKLPAPVVYKVHKKSRVSKTRPIGGLSKTKRPQSASDYEQKQDNGEGENKTVTRLTEGSLSKTKAWSEQSCGIETEGPHQTQEVGLQTDDTQHPFEDLNAVKHKPNCHSPKRVDSLHSIVKAVSNAPDYVELEEGYSRSSQHVEVEDNVVRYRDHIDILGNSMEKLHDPIGSSKSQNCAVSCMETNMQTTTSVPSSSIGTLESAPGNSGPLRRVDNFFGEQTSVWDSSSSFAHDPQTVPTKEGGQLACKIQRASAAQHNSQERDKAVSETEMRFLGTEELVRQRQNIAMELLWVQQAIISRKQYLKLRTQMEVAA